MFLVRRSRTLSGRQTVVSTGAKTGPGLTRCAVGRIGTAGPLIRFQCKGVRNED
jgi:hypothetical protein